MFCPKCSMLKNNGRCLCTRPQRPDVGTPMQRPSSYRSCPKCGNPVRPDSKYMHCFECRRLENPAAVAEKEYDEFANDNERTNASRNWR